MSAPTSTRSEYSPPKRYPRMNKELFGVFGDRLTSYRTPAEFDRVVGGRAVSIGIRDPGLDFPYRSTTYECADGLCAIWGEAFPREETPHGTAQWLFERFADVGADALNLIDGSYLVVIEYDGRALVASDRIRSWECFYADVDGARVFGTDAGRVAAVLPDPTIDELGVTDMIHFGVVLGDRTMHQEIRRAPFDGYLTADDTGTLDRFVHDPREDLDHVDRLATRLEGAIRRRSRYPGTTGIMMSAGFDSRTILSVHSDIDRCYTLGESADPEVRVAKSVAEQYGSAHDRLPVTDRYLDQSPAYVRYTNGVRESLHIHHRGNDDRIDADTMYHGLFLDTLLRGHYLPWDALDVLGRPFPLPRLDPDPDVPAHFGKKLGFFSESDRLLVECDALDVTTTEEFLEARIEPVYQRHLDAVGDSYGAIARMGVELTPPLPFRLHLADNFHESLVVGDAGLLDWHLETPLRHQNDRTYQNALRRIDDDIFRHRPPDRPHYFKQVNAVEGFLRRNLPGLTEFGTPWPDRDRIYEANDMDRLLFPDHPELHALPPRVKLRINDVRVWFESTIEDLYHVDDIICPTDGGIDLFT